jgi:hypothetical protein
MKRALTCLALATVMFLSQTVEAATFSRGGFSIDSYRSGGSYPRSSIRFMTGRGPRMTRHSVGAGHFNRSGTPIFDTSTTGRTSFLGQWAGGPRGSVVVDYGRRGDNFAFVWANEYQHAIVTNIDFY